MRPLVNDTMLVPTGLRTILEDLLQALYLLDPNPNLFQSALVHALRLPTPSVKKEKKKKGLFGAKAKTTKSKSFPKHVFFFFCLSQGKGCGILSYYSAVTLAELPAESLTRISKRNFTFDSVFKKHIYFWV